MPLGHQAQLLLLLRMGVLGTAFGQPHSTRENLTWTIRHENNSLLTLEAMNDRELCSCPNT